MFSFQSLNATTGSNTNTTLINSGSNNNHNNYIRCSQILEHIHQQQNRNSGRKTSFLKNFIPSVTSSEENSTPPHDPNTLSIHRVQHVSGHLALHLFNGRMIIGLDYISASKLQNITSQSQDQLYLNLLEAIKNFGSSTFATTHNAHDTSLGPMLFCCDKDPYVYSDFEIREETSEQSSGYNFGSNFVRDLRVVRFIAISKAGNVMVWRYYEDNSTWKVENTFNILGNSSSLKVEFATVVADRNILFKTNSPSGRNALNLYSASGSTCVIFNGSSDDSANNGSENVIYSVFPSTHTMSKSTVLIITQGEIILFDLKNKKSISKIEKALKYNDASGNADMQQYSESIFYISMIIHPITKEIIMMDTSFNIIIYSSELTHSKKLSINKLTLKKENILKIDMALIYNTFLAIYDGNSNIFIVDLVNGCVISNLMLPSDMTNYKSGGSFVRFFGNATQYSCNNEPSTLFIHGSSLIYELRCPPLLDIVRNSSTVASSGNSLTSSTTSQTYNHLLKDFKLFNIYTRNILEEIHNNSGNSTNKLNPASNSTVDMRKSIFPHLENPALIWTSCNTVHDQEAFLNECEQFIDNFPPKDTNFWKKPTSNASTSENWESSSLPSPLSPSMSPSSLSSSKASPTMGASSTASSNQLFTKMTTLNMSIVPPLTSSLSICKEQITNLDVTQTVDSLEDHGENSAASSNIKTSSFMDNLTDIELYDMIENEPHSVLDYLLDVCDLAIFKSVVQQYSTEENLDETSDSSKIYGISIPGASDSNIRPITTFVNLFEQNFEDSISPLELYKVEENRNEDFVVYQNKVTAALEPKRNTNHTRKGLLYFEMVIRLLFFHTKCPQIILILIVMMEEHKLKQFTARRDQLKSEIDQLVKKKQSSSTSSLSSLTGSKNYQLENFNLQSLQNEYNDISQKLKQNNLKAKYSKEIQRILTSYVDTCESEQQFIETASYSNIQVKTMAQLFIWQGNRLDALKIYLSNYSNKLEEQVLKLVSTYLSQQSGISVYHVPSGTGPLEEQYQVLNLLFNFCLNPSTKATSKTKNSLLALAWQMMPLSYSVFDFFSKFDIYWNERGIVNSDDNESSPCAFTSADICDEIALGNSNIIGDDVGLYLQGIGTFTNMKLRAQQMK
ncbi:hypothetical protein C9374_014119 [Naegleria lovaniensis]|uniref:Uncharacterized protein n=1 Tax=Naegleria lovaniensis TaxID=51637 RepID=A0AA88KPV9_NAELO|nr:uncharacterized protein C9374_014119 [Naegleria lovaniensis]KAG2389559.1 hypothetical protein C9374_014119 [Naegleria lovaniensis]